MKHKLFLFLAAIGMMLPQLVSAYDFEVDGIYYNTSGSNATVTYETSSYNSYSGIVVIPATVTYNDVTYNVTSIGESAFYKCSSLTSVTIPNSVTSIENYAFSECSGLTSVTIPNSVTSIGKSAFYGCSGLTSVTIPNSVTSIGNYAFRECSGLISVTIPNSVTSIGEGAFGYCSGLTSVTIGSSVTSIGVEAFRGCSGLTSVTIPNSVTSIGDYAFYGCSGLISVNIPNSVTSIKGSAFEGCTGLTSVTIPNSVTSIGKRAFYGCSGLTSVTIGSGVTSIGNRAFEGCSGLTSITIGSDNTHYDSRDNCNAIIETASNTLIAGCKNTIIPNSVTSIGGYAFYGCTGLTSVTIGNSVTSIGNSAFYGCSGLTSVTIPNSVTIIGEYAFRNCTGLTSVTIGNSVTSIRTYAFNGCSAIKEVYAKPLVPPTYGDKTFNDNVCTTATLYVPNTNNCFTRYSGKEGWNNFRNIVEYDMSLLDEDPDGKPCATPTIAYKDGKLVFNNTTSGAEYHSNITAQDAGTGITSGSELKLAATYDISVYATAEGCARSASAYATLAFNLDSSGTEEEGIISVMASPVLINAEGGTLYVSGLTNATEVEYFTLEGRTLGRSMVKDGCTMFTTDQPKGSTVIVTVNGRGAKVVVR